MGFLAGEEAKRLTGGERFEERLKRRIDLAAGARVDRLCPQDETIPHERTTQRRAGGRAVGRPIRQIDDDVGRVPGPAGTHGKAGIMRGDVGLGPGVDQPPQSPGREIERAKGGVAMKENGTRCDLGLPGPPQ